VDIFLDFRLTETLYFRDWLDCDLHSSILSSLAANLASTSSHDDLDLLTNSFASRQAAPVTNGTITNLVNRLGQNDSPAPAIQPAVSSAPTFGSHSRRDRADPRLVLDFFRA